MECNCNQENTKRLFQKIKLRNFNGFCVKKEYSFKLCENYRISDNYLNLYYIQIQSKYSKKLNKYEYLKLIIFNGRWHKNN